MSKLDENEWGAAAPYPFTVTTDSTAPPPYPIWNLEAPFTKTGFPVVGSFGRTIRPVIIMEVETFQRLVKEHPSPETAQFKVGELTDP